MDELIKREESLDHLKHFGKRDPNRVIYDSYIGRGQTEKAEKYLAYRKAWESAVSERKTPPFPYFVTIGLINACNISCAHCYRTYNKDRTPKNVLEFEEVENIISQCKEAGVYSMALGSESEPLLYGRIKEVIKLISDKKFEDSWLCTNGLLLDDEYADLILNSNITRLTISIDAITSRTYRRVRGGDFNRLMSNIFNFLAKREKMKKQLPILRVTFVRYNLTEGEATPFVDFWSRIADEVDVQPLIDIKNVDLLRYETIDKISCSYPNRMMYVNWNGDYKPCCAEFCKHLTIGNIREMSVLDAWNSAYLNGLRDQLSGKTPLNKACLNCLRSLHSVDKYEPVCEMDN